MSSKGNCDVCNDFFGSKIKLNCCKCENIICENCSRFSQVFNGVVCSDCEFFDRLQKDVKRKDEKKTLGASGWLKGATVPSFWSSTKSARPFPFAFAATTASSSTTVNQSNINNASVSNINLATPTPHKTQSKKSGVKTVMVPAMPSYADITPFKLGTPDGNMAPPHSSGNKSKLGSHLFSRSFFSRVTGSRKQRYYNHDMNNNNTTSSNIDLETPNTGILSTDVASVSRFADVSTPSTEMREAISNVDKLTNMVNEKDEEIHGLKHEIEDLKQRVNEAEVNLRSSQDKALILEDTRDSLLKRIKELEDEVKRLNDTLSVASLAASSAVNAAASALVAAASASGENSTAIADPSADNSDDVSRSSSQASTIPIPPPLPGTKRLSKPKSLQPTTSAIIVPSGGSPPAYGYIAGTTIPVPPPLPGTANKGGLFKIPLNPGGSQENANGQQISTATGASHGMPHPPTHGGRRSCLPSDRGSFGRPSKFNKKESVRQLVQKKKEVAPKVGCASPTKSPTKSTATATTVNAAPELRPVFWNVIPGSRVEGTLWDEIGSGVDDMIKDNSDVQHFLVLEEKFAKPKSAAQTRKSLGGGKAPTSTDDESNGDASNAADNGISSSGATVSKATRKQVSAPPKPKILDATRSQNIQIALGRTLLKDPTSIKKIRQAIISLDRKVLTPDVVTQLLNYIPTPDECKKIDQLTAENAHDPNFWKGLSPAEDFIYQMSAIPRLRQRLQCLFVESSFDSQSKTLEEAISDYESACKKLKDSNNWKQLLKLVLAAGNYLNDSNPARAGAWGFELTSGLPKLGEVKAGSKYSLLHWIAEVAENKCPGVFSLPQELSILDKVEKIKLEDLKSELVNLTKGVQLMKKEIELCEQASESSNNNNLSAGSSNEGAKEFATALNPFYKNLASPMVEDLNKRLLAVETAARNIVIFHGEKETTVTSQKLFEVIMSFCKSVERVHVEIITDRKAAEEKEAKMASEKMRSNNDQNVNTINAVELGGNKSAQKIRKVDTKNGVGMGHGLQLNEVQDQLGKLMKVSNSSNVHASATKQVQFGKYQQQQTPSKLV